MSDDGEMVPDRRLRRPPAPETSIESEDLLGECLMRLPPQPSSLPRASLVCKRWRRLVSDPDFLRRFRAHHGRPPLIGYFSFDSVASKIKFTPALDPPDRVPAERFSLRFDHQSIGVLDCRHGLVLCVDWKRCCLLVWDPVSGDRYRVAIPPEFGKNITAAVICAAGDNSHAHGANHSSPFNLVMVDSNQTGVNALVYSSETGTWGNLISEVWSNLIPPSDAPHYFCFNYRPGVLIGNSIYWLLMDGVWTSASRWAVILEIDLDRQSLAVITLPPGVYDDMCRFLITHADSGGLGFVILSCFSAKLWKWNANTDGVAEWLPVKTIELSNLLSLSSSVITQLPDIIAFSEDNNAMILSTFDGVFMIYLESLQFKKLPEIKDCHIYPFTSFYPAGA